jgi:hypothetical protein
MSDTCDSLLLLSHVSLTLLPLPVPLHYLHWGPAHGGMEGGVSRRGGLGVLGQRLRCSRLGHGGTHEGRGAMSHAKKRTE